MTTDTTADIPKLATAEREVMRSCQVPTIMMNSADVARWIALEVRRCAEDRR